MFVVCTAMGCSKTVAVSTPLPTVAVFPPSLRRMNQMMKRRRLTSPFQPPSYSFFPKCWSGQWIICFPPRIDCYVTAYFTRHSSTPPSFLFPWLHPPRTSQRIKRRRRTSPFRHPSYSSADPDSKYCILSRPHGLIIVSLHIIMP